MTIRQFVVRKDFWSEETQSQYCAGLHYTVQSDKLRALVLRWLKENLIEEANGRATMSAKGE